MFKNIYKRLTISVILIIFFLIQVKISHDKEMIYIYHEMANLFVSYILITLLRESIENTFGEVNRKIITKINNKIKKYLKNTFLLRMTYFVIFVISFFIVIFIFSYITFGAIKDEMKFALEIVFIQLIPLIVLFSQKSVNLEEILEKVFTIFIVLVIGLVIVTINLIFKTKFITTKVTFKYMFLVIVEFFKLMEKKK